MPFQTLKMGPGDSARSHTADEFIYVEEIKEGHRIVHPTFKPGIMKLWQKENTSVSAQIEKFTVGRDKEFDILLAKYDVEGSIAHVTMLGEVGLMSKEEAHTGGKRSQGNTDKRLPVHNSAIADGVEDVHSQVELLLTQRIGDAGKMIHSGRSRNDQVAVDIKLYLRAEVLAVKEEVKQLFDLLIAQSEEFKHHVTTGIYPSPDAPCPHRLACG